MINKSGTHNYCLLKIFLCFSFILHLVDEIFYTPFDAEIKCINCLTCSSSPRWRGAHCMASAIYENNRKTLYISKLITALFGCFPAWFSGAVHPHMQQFAPL